MKKHEMIEELHWQVWHSAAWLKSVYDRFQKGETTKQELLKAYTKFKTTKTLAHKLLDYKDYVNASIGLPQGLPTEEDINKAMEREDRKW